MADVRGDEGVEYRLPRWPLLLQAGLVLSIFVVFFVIMPLRRDPNARLSCAPHCNEVAFPPLLILAIFVVVAFIGIAVPLSTRVRLTANGIERTVLFRTTLIPWSNLSGITTTSPKGKRPGNAVLALVEGKAVSLPLLSPNGHRWRSPSLSALFKKSNPDENPLVVAIRTRLGDPDPLPPPPAAWLTVTSTPPIIGHDRSSRRIHIAMVLVVDLVLVVVLLASLGVLLGGFTHNLPVDDVPMGRPYTTYESVSGVVSYGVQCPRPLESASGDDPLCREHGAGLLRGGLIAFAIAGVLLGAQVVWVVRRRKRKRRQAQAAPRPDLLERPPHPPVEARAPVPPFQPSPPSGPPGVSPPAVVVPSDPRPPASPPARPRSGAFGPIVTQLPSSDPEEPSRDA